MKNLLVTIAMVGFMGFAVAQETPTKKPKSKQDTIINRTTKSKFEKKSTYKTDSTKTNPAKKNTTAGKTKKMRKDSIPPL
ncbi:hypothetical protein IRZ83_14435 [Flavobacterium sp. JLP]|uniref:hypothetical protein n=1 Tax=Flavobacterium sp. JLP TaxID=2783793 RepID=UPI001889DEC5|nr:hypothetical protein [Flavobacterium sp. JLP]MBF4507871.1 hypothetical protein [Flavobacterium sp. JLP]